MIKQPHFRFRIASLNALLLLMALSCTPPDKDYACINPHLMVDDLAHISSMDWQLLTPATIQKEWPAAPQNRYVKSHGGINSFSKALKKCFGINCDLCGIAYSNNTRNLPVLTRLEVITRADSRVAAIRHVRMLVAASINGDISDSYDMGWSKLDEINRFFYTAKWHSYNDSFILEARVNSYEGKWLGGVSITRIVPTKCIEKWKVADGTEICITRIALESAKSGSEKQLRFEYKTNGFLLDPECRRLEVEMLWPKLKELLERENPSKASIAVQDETGGSMGMAIGKDPSGKWLKPDL